MTQKNEIIEWVGRGNTNPAVLGSMIDSLESGESGGSGIPVGNTINFTNNTSGSVTVKLTTGAGYDNTAMLIPSIDVAPNSTLMIYAFSGERGGQYYIILVVDSITDQYSITTGSTAWEYDDREGSYGYTASNSSPINGETYNVVIANKE